MPHSPFSGDIFALCDIVRETTFTTHKWFRHGQFEKVYERSPHQQIEEGWTRCAPQFPLPMFDEDGTLVGDYFTDLLVDAP